MGADASGTAQAKADAALASAKTYADNTALHFINSDDFTVVDGSSTTGSYLATKWSVSGVDGITVPDNGMSIALRTPGVGYMGGILLSIDGGNNYYPLARNVDSLITTNYGAGCTIILTFNSTQSIAVYLTSGKKTTITGCWQVADYDSNTYVRQYYTTTDGNYPLLFKYDEGLTTTKSYVTTYARNSNNVYANPSTGALYADALYSNGNAVSVDGHTHSEYALASHTHIDDIDCGTF